MKFKDPIGRGKKISESLKGHPCYKNKERGMKISKALKGRPSSFKGKKHTEEAKQANRIKHIGKKPTKKQLEALNLGSGWNKGKNNEWMLGTKNHSWKGGVTPLMNKIRHSLEYTQWRDDVFRRDNYTCQGCKKRGGNLEAHHDKKSFSEIISENKIDSMEKARLCKILWDINNGKTFCPRCHSRNDKQRRLKKDDMIIGLGEVGNALEKCYKKEQKPITFDPNKKESIIKSQSQLQLYRGRIRCIHICIPFIDKNKFIMTVLDNIFTILPDIVIIHSTITLGTTRCIYNIARDYKYNCIVAHSPIVGKHPDLYGSIKDVFRKTIATLPNHMITRGKVHKVLGEDMGIKYFIWFKSPETTELAKLFSTTRYANYIAIATEMKRICDEYKVDFDEAFTQWEENYNEGYSVLDMNHVVRPVLKPCKGKTGGHCIRENMRLIKKYMKKTWLTDVKPKKMFHLK